jgi:hypothetical protein
MDQLFELYNKLKKFRFTLSVVSERSTQISQNVRKCIARRMFKKSWMSIQEVEELIESNDCAISPCQETPVTSLPPPPPPLVEDEDLFGDRMLEEETITSP